MATKRSFKWNEKQLRMFVSEDCYYATNDYGQGVFYIDQVENERKQITGTSQFSIRGLKPKSAKNKIRRFVDKRNEKR